MNRWNLVRLDTIAKLQSGVGFPIHLQGNVSGQYPVYKVGDISRRAREGMAVLGRAQHYVGDADLVTLGARPLPKGTIVFAKIGEAIRQNFLAITDCDSLIDNNAIGVVPDSQHVSLRFLFQYLKTIDFYRLADKTSVPSIRKSTLERLMVPLPDMEEQRRIAAILDQAEALRTKRRQALAKLDTLTQSLFLDMFGDASRNPRNWPQRRLGEMFAEPPSYGTMIPPSDKGQWLSLRVGNIQDWQLDLSDSKYIDLPASRIKKFSLVDGDVLLARAIASLDHLGKCVIVHPGDEDWAFDSHLMRLRLDTSAITPEYLCALLQTRGGRSLFLAVTRRSAVQFNVNTKEIRSLRIPLPPIPSQLIFKNKLKSVGEQANKMNASMLKTDCLFAALQHRAFRGEL